VPATPKFKKIEGESYLYELTYPSGTKGYAVRATRAGVPGKKQYFPFTKDGLAKAKTVRNTWLEKTEEITKELLKKGPIDPAIKKMANPTDPKKPWRYKRSDSPDTFHATEQDAKNFQTKAKELKYAANTKIPKSDFTSIKNKIIAGDTLEKIATSYDADVDTVRHLLNDNKTTYSQLTPNVSYRKDKDLRKLLKDNYGKLSRASLAKKLFPDLPIASASNKVGTLTQDMVKDGEIKTLQKGQQSEEVAARTSTDPKNVKANIISKRRSKKLTGLGSKKYEDHLRNFKADLQKFLGLKTIVRKDGSEFYPIDMGHRADIDQIKALSKFGARLNATDLGPDYYESNRRGINTFKTGVKTLERKLKPLYTTQKNLLVRASKFDVEDIPESLKKLIDKNNDDIRKLVGDGIGGRIKPITINVDTLEVLKGDQKIIKSLGMGFVDKPMSEIQFPNRLNSFTGSEDDVIIKANLGEQVLKEAVDEGLIDSKKGKILLQEFFKRGASPTVVAKSKGRMMPIAAAFAGTVALGSLFGGGSATAGEITQPQVIEKPETVQYNRETGSFVNPITQDKTDQNALLQWGQENPLTAVAGTSVALSAQEIPRNYKMRRGVGDTGPLPGGKGRIRSSIGIGGALKPVLTTLGTPLVGLGFEGLMAKERLENDESFSDILMDPLGPSATLAFMEPLSRSSGVVRGAPTGIKNYFKNYGDLSNVGQARPGLTSKALRLGLSPRMIAGASRFLGLPGLALTTGLAGYNAYKNYQNEEGMIYDFFNKDE
jgi:hypothetical protein